jgi:hypothetical protein
VPETKNLNRQQRVGTSVVFVIVRKVSDQMDEQVDDVEPRVIHRLSGEHLNTSNVFKSSGESKKGGISSRK